MFETEFAIEKNKGYIAGKKLGLGAAFMIFVSAFYLIISLAHGTMIKYYQVATIALLLYLIYIVGGFVFSK